MQIENWFSRLNTLLLAVSVPLWLVLLLRPGVGVAQLPVGVEEPVVSPPSPSPTSVSVCFPSAASRPPPACLADPLADRLGRRASPRLVRAADEQLRLHVVGGRHLRLDDRRRRSSAAGCRPRRHPAGTGLPSTVTSVRNGWAIR